MAGKLLVVLFTVCVSLATLTVADDALCRGVEYNRFVRDPSSCARYFLCRNNRAISGTCEDNLHFDYDKQMCRYPSEVRCEVTTVAPTQTPEGPIENWVCIGRAHNSFCPDPRRCGSFFLCLNQIGRPGNCGHRFWFHPILNICTNPGGFCTPRENVCDNGVDANGRNCEDTETTTSPIPPTTTPIPPITTSTTTTIAPTTQEPSGPLEAWVCIGIANNVFRNHPHRCGAYFLCRNFIGILGSCPRRSWFHPNSHLCVNPGSFCTPSELECDNGIDGNGQNCEGDREPTPTQQPTTTSTTTTTVTTPSTVAPTTQEPSGPLEAWVCIGIANNVFRNHPHRCGAYFLCRNFIGVLGSCPRRSWFHPNSHLCVNPGSFCTPTELECDNGIDGNGQNCEGDREPTPTQQPTTTTTVSPTTPSGPIELWICIGVQNNRFRGHPNLCGSFFLCISNVGFVGSCPRGFWFHPHHQACTSPSLSFCTPQGSCDNGVGQNCPRGSSEESIESASSESNSSEDCDSESNDSGSNSGSSDSNDSKSNSSENSNDSSGSSDSSDSSSSNSRRNTNRCHSSESGNRGPCSGRPTGTLVANPLACGSFYYCMLEVPLPVECDSGLWFNPNSNLCQTPGSFCTSTLPCDNGVGNGCGVTTDDPIITPTHATTLSL